MVVVRRCSSFFNDPSAVSLVTAFMASVTTVQVVVKEAKEGEAIWKVLEAERKVIVAEVAQAVLALAQMEKTMSSSQVTPPPTSPPRKHCHLTVDGAHQCRRWVVPGIAVNGCNDSEPYAEVEGMLGVARSS
jgi:hypothetical protein